MLRSEALQLLGVVWRRGRRYGPCSKFGEGCWVGFQETQEVRTSERWARRVASTQVCLVVVAVAVYDAALDLD